MGQKPRHIFFGSILLCIVLALVPPLTMLLVDVSPALVLLACLGCFGWLVAAILLFYDGLVLDSVSDALDSLGIPQPNGGMNEYVEYFAEQAAKYHRAAYTFLGSTHLEANSLNQNLLRILSLTYAELDAQSVELSLFDEQSGLNSQSMLLGDALSSEVQTMLLAEGHRSDAFTRVVQDAQKSTIISTPVKFAGSTFGMLRAEFEGVRDLTGNEKQVFQLLAAQGAILLVDAQFNDELLRMRRTSEESVRAKTGFLANLSHEIRGPLGVILNGAELALEGLCGELTPQMQETLTMVKTSGEHLLDLVNDVLDYAKVEAGKVQVTPVKLPLKGLLEDIAAVVRSQAIQKGHSLLVEPVPVDWAVVCDKRHARQMLINFLTNAIKYTPEGGKIRVYTEVIANTMVKIAIEDTGIGIAPEEQHKVFGAFERVDDAYAQSQMGTGLGMPLTARLAEVNHGSVGFASTKGEGSTFWLSLPFEHLDADYFQEEEESGKVFVSGQGELILLVDHDDGSRDMLKRYLDQRGFHTVPVRTAQELVRTLRTQPIALALVENDIPDLPGEEMVAMIRSMPQGAGIPVVLMSARAFVFDVEQFLRLGVDRCLAKPVALAEVAMTIRILLDQAETVVYPN